MNIRFRCGFFWSLLFWVLAQCIGLAVEKPNIVWITSEDNDYGWLGCYGDKQAKTPHLDALAAEGVLFEHAYSNAPVCAVARSTIITGTYAVTQGTQHMRSRHKISPEFKPYTSYLKTQGYYCTNKTKTDYNFDGRDQSYWDECSGKAHYKNRPEGAPFFAIFNLTVSHESSLFKDKIKKNRKQGIIPKTTRIAPEDVVLRPYLPDLPEIRSDVAIYHDVMTALDRQVAEILDELEKSGLAENTIVFYYGDHGGVTPRGKRYLKDSGTRIPLLLRVPEKWQHLSQFKPGERVDMPVSFIDLAPTLLSLASAEKPSHMQGQAFLGKDKIDTAKQKYVFLFADRFDEFYGMRRGLTDGRWKYIRRFSPQLAAAPYSNYQFGQAGWIAWRKAWQDGKLSGRHKAIWENNQPVEELFDTLADPWEVNNLAADPAHAERLKTLRSALKTTMVKAVDTGLAPESMFSELTKDEPISDYMSEHSKSLESLVDLAFLASSADVSNLDELQKMLTNKDPLMRYWAAQGMVILGKKAASAEPRILPLLADTSASIRISAAHALYLLGKEDESTKALIAELEKDNDEYVKLLAQNVIIQLGETDKISDAWIAATMKDKKAGNYVRRLASILKDERKGRKK